MSDDRIVQLNEILAENPADQMARYGLAMEYANRGQLETAMLQFRTLLTQHPGYVPGYQMLAQTMMRNGMGVQAREVLRKGIETASSSGNAHAVSEMQGMLDELG